MNHSLTAVEHVTARLFFNVGIQSAFALEDPNVRFAGEFNQKEMAGYKGASRYSDIEQKSYVTDVEDGQAVLVVKPPKGPAWAQVLMKGGRPEVVIDAVIDGMGKVQDQFRVQELDSLPAAPGREAAPTARNRFFKLVIDPKFNADHDVAVLFSWGLSSDKDTASLDLMAWPAFKTAEQT